MFQVTLIHADQSRWEAGVFSTRLEAGAWIQNECQQPYWKSDTQVILEDITPPEVVLDNREILAAKWEALRKARNAALAACDWCMLGDAPLDKEQKAIMANYRQALRTLPENSHDPDQLSLPEYPKL